MFYALNPLTGRPSLGAAPARSRRASVIRSVALGVATSCLLMGLPQATPAIASVPIKIAQGDELRRPLLRLGSTGNAVIELQALLTLLGYYTNAVDGEYQASTQAAVEQFQADVGLDSDGIVGPATWEKLLPTPSTDFDPPAVTAATDESADEAADDTKEQPVDLPVLREGMRGSAVTRVQETLRSRGFYSGSVDGVFGPATRSAVMDFQRSVGLAADGVVGPATWGALLR